MNSIYINNIIKDEPLTGKAAAVLHILAIHSNVENSCFPSLKTIAKECKMSVRTVQRGLDELLKRGLITKKHNYRANGSQTSNVYKIIVAIEERAAAIEENAMLKIRDMKKRLEYKLARKQQTSIFPPVEEALSETKADQGRFSNRTSLIALFKNFAGLTRMLKNSDLTTPHRQHG